jgi:hypothetical protein
MDKQHGAPHYNLCRSSAARSGVGPFNVTKLQQSLPFLCRVQAPLSMSDLRQRRGRRKATAMPGVRSSHRSGFLLSSPTIGTRLEIEGTEGSIVGIIGHVHLTGDHGCAQPHLELNHAGRDRFGAKVDTAHRQLIRTHRRLPPNGMGRNC